MNESGVSIDLAELKSIANSIQTQREEIQKIYSGPIVSVLNASNQCFSISGLNLNKIYDEFNKCFQSIDLHLGNLEEVLNNNVIKNYSEVQTAIKQMFNNEFASKFSSLLDTFSGLR